MLHSLPYSSGLILDNTHNYGIMKTETVFGFGSPNQNNFGNNSFNATDPLEWIFSDGNFQRRSLQAHSPKPYIKPIPIKVYNTVVEPKPKEKKINKEGKKKHKKRKSKKINKCIIKFMKGGGGQGSEEYSSKRKKRRRGNKMGKMQKKFMMPLILGLLAAKSLLIPIALKALAFLSAKGLMMGFFSTILASLISLKGLFSHPHESSHRKDDSKTQVEIIQVPTKSEDHIYYDDHYRRGDLIPIFATPEELQRYENNMLKRKSSKDPWG